MHEDEETRAELINALEDSASSWRSAQLEADQRRALLIADVIRAADEGLSEYAIARAVGVQRMTIRAWLGKGPR